MDKDLEKSQERKIKRDSKKKKNKGFFINELLKEVQKVGKTKRKKSLIHKTNIRKSISSVTVSFSKESNILWTKRRISRF